MSNIINIDIRTKWDVPVSVVARDGIIDDIAGPGDGLAFLASRSTGNTGPAHREAHKGCRDALRGVVPPNEARKLFVAACREAGILVSHF